MPDQPQIVPLFSTGRKGERRPSSTQRGYDQKHRKLAKECLRLNPICQRCKNAFAVDADHLVYPAKSVADYQSLCRACHNRKTFGRT